MKTQIIDLSTDANIFNAHLFQIVVGAIVECGEAGGVSGVALGDADHHALARASQQDAVGVDLVCLALFLADVQPAVAGKREVLPSSVVPAQVAVPDEAGPIELQPLHIEL